jgi:ATP-dependent RNA helicase DHX8/PRP22
MAALPLDPMYSRTVLAALELGCAADVLTIIAMLGAENIFVVPKDKKAEAAQARANFSSPYGDHLALLNVWNSWHVAQRSTDWCFDNFISARAMKKVSVRIVVCLPFALSSLLRRTFASSWCPTAQTWGER